MKRVLFTILIILATINSYAYDFSAVCSTGQTLYYNITSDSTVCLTFPSVCSTPGGYACDGPLNYYCQNEKPTGFLVIPDTVHYNGVAYIVNSIGASTFQQCNGLDSVVIGNNIYTIGAGAFNNCTSLKYVYIGHSVNNIGNYAFNGTVVQYLFYDCPNVSVDYNIVEISTNEPIFGSIISSIHEYCHRYVLTDPFYSIRERSDLTIEFGPNMTRVPKWLLYREKFTRPTYFDSHSWSESYLKADTIILGPNIRTIEDSLFMRCGLSHIVFSSNLDSIGKHAFDGCNQLSSIQFPENVSYIGEYAFKGCSNLHGAISFPPNIKEITRGAFDGCTQLGNIYISDSIKTIGSFAFANNISVRSIHIGLGVDSIGEHAFINCKGTETMHIPNNVKYVGEKAFYGCTDFDTIIISNMIESIGDSAFSNLENIYTLSLDSLSHMGESAFSDCININDLTIGSKLKHINKSAFKNNRSVSRLSIPDNIVLIDEYAFYGCSSIDSLRIGNGVDSINSNSFNGCSGVQWLSIPDNVKTIGISAFKNCSAIDSIYIGSNVTYIGTDAFYGCTNVRAICYNSKNCITPLCYQSNPLTNTISSLFLGDSVQRIPSKAFYHCDNILSINTNSNEIGDDAFANCDHLVSVTLGESVQALGSNVFRGCQQLQNINLDGVVSIGDSAFTNCYNLLNIVTGARNIGRNAFSNCDRIVSVTLGDSTQTLGNGAFSGCFRLQNINLGGVTAIGDSTFTGCVRLEQPKLPTGLQTIGLRAFDNCNVLAGKLTFPATVTSIGDYAYNGVGTITEIEMQGSNPPTIYEHTFNGVSNSVPVSVPCDAVLSYYTTNYWEIFPNIVEAPPYRLTVGSNNETMGSAAVAQQPTCSNHSAIIQATAQTGFHFLQWQDGNTANPRTIQMSQDSSFTAIFVQNNSYITIHANDSTMGAVTGTGLYTYNAPVTMTATAYSGYHFLKWSDGNTQNPRYMVAVRDTNFTAIFVSNVSNITVANANPDMGNVSGSGIYYYQNLVSITATPVYGYHFAQWNDGNQQNPRTITVNQDSNFTAYFAPNLYNINATSNSTVMGSVSGGGSYTYLHNMSLTATPAFGYHFVQWNDQVTDNPRTITVTRDSAFTAQFAANSYAITAESNDPTMGSAYGSGSYNFNTSATLTAVAEYGYHFTQWSDGITDNPRTITVQNAATYTAQFEINSYILTVQSSNPAIGTTSGGGSYNYLTPVNITANPNAGYHFTQWSDGNTDNPRLVSVTQNATYTAQFAINSYAVSVQSSNTNMGSVSGSGTYNHNSTATLTATAYYGYHFVQWQDGNTQNPRNVVVTDSALYTAEFTYNSYLVTANSSNVTLGSATGGGSYNYLSQVALTAVPVPHYHFTMWNDSIEDNPRTITVTRDTILTAHFAIDRHSITLYGDDVMGDVDFLVSEIELNDPLVLQVDYNTAVWIAANANYGYHFTQWNDGNTQNPRRVVVLQDTAFTALFAPNQYTATCTVNDNTRGTVATTGGSFNYLTQITFTAQPTADYHFLHWSNGSTDNPITFTLTQDTTLTAILVGLSAQTSDSTMGTTLHSKTSNLVETVTAVANYGYHFVQWNDGNTDNPRTINLTGDTTVTAIFAINQYTLNVVSNDNALGTVTGSGEYNYLSQVTISATAATHSHFTQWSDGNTTNPRLITLTSDTSFTAIFETDPQYQITVVANDSFFGTVSGSGTYYQGETATITATANEHYYFSQWSDGVSTNPRMVTVTGDATYTAVFEPVMYTVTVEANDYTMGQVAGSGSYAYGSTATIEARAFGGYRFTSWSDGDTTAKRTITVIDDISLTASFVPNVCIGDVVKPDYNIYVQYGHIIVEGVDKERVRIFDITGRPYSHEDHLPAGVYLVHIDGTVTKKVVVL